LYCSLPSNKLNHILYLAIRTYNIYKLISDVCGRTLSVCIHTGQAEKFAWLLWESNPQPLGYYSPMFYQAAELWGQVGSSWYHQRKLLTPTHTKKLISVVFLLNSRACKECFLWRWKWPTCRYGKIYLMLNPFICILS
jgi:hypothetical protein